MKKAVTARSTTELVRYDDADAVTEQSVIAGFLAGDTGSTRVGFESKLIAGSLKWADSAL